MSQRGFTLRRASGIVGGLSSPGKMPCSSYGLPAKECGVGSRLRAASRPGRETVCGKCYALKGRYPAAAVQRAQYWRLESLSDPRWVDAMVTLIGWYERRSRVFRWHDSGDLQGREHLQLIADVAEALPWVRFWLPTRETRIVREFGELPENLTARVSAALVGYVPTAEGCWSAVLRRDQPAPDGVFDCPARHQGSSCGECRACWDKDVTVVARPLH